MFVLLTERCGETEYPIILVLSRIAKIDTTPDGTTRVFYTGPLGHEEITVAEPCNKIMEVLSHATI